MTGRIIQPCWEWRVVKWLRGLLCRFLWHKWYEGSMGTWRICGYCRRKERWNPKVSEWQ